MSLSPIPEIIEELRQGRMIILIDDESRENEGDLVLPAQYTTPEAVNFMLREGRGMICVALEADICDRLDLPMPASRNTSQRTTAYTITVDASEKFGVTTGVSAFDRAATIQRLASSEAKPADFDRPGHMQPLRAREGGVLVRTGQTEGSVDLCKLGGLRPAATIIEIMNEDGTMARLPELKTFCEKHDMKMCTVADLIAYRMEQESLVERVVEDVLNTPEGEFRLIGYRSKVDPLMHIALVKGRVGYSVTEDPILVRMHSHNVLGDVFGDVDHRTDLTLRAAMRQVQQAGEGAIVYMRSEGMGSGLSKNLQQMQHDSQLNGESPREITNRTVTKPQRFDYGLGSQILHDLGIRNIKLLTNSPKHFSAIEGFGLSISGVEAIQAIK